MSVGQRRAFRRIASSLGGLSQSQREAALLIQRSPGGPDILAVLIDENLDAEEIGRIAREVLRGVGAATKTFASFDTTLLQSLGRVLLLNGTVEAFDRGLEILRALAEVRGLQSMSPKYRRLAVEASIAKREFGLASDYIDESGSDGQQLLLYRLGLHNPFIPENPQALPVPEWLKLFNSFFSPSGDLAPIELAADLGPTPFDQLWSSANERRSGPMVTVVMSAFRRDATIFGAVHSILNQTWESLELLIIDDDSGPEYEALYDALAVLDPRIRIVRQRVNGGTYLIRNRAINLARGEFITFQDSDDWSHPERIERQIVPLLSDESLVATQSSCYRTDDFLDPVQVGHKNPLRRNESSLLFRLTAVRRVGYFHFTRKGGDTEFRRRLEAAYGRPTMLVGPEPLALVRLTAESLSRNEFSPGFRIPGRLIYSQGYALVHTRAKEDDSFYLPSHEYREPYLPENFRPRREDFGRRVIDAVVVADLRACAAFEEWIVSTVSALDSANLKVGLAHCVGLRLVGLSFDRISPEVSALFVDGQAEPVLFSEHRRVRVVLVSDPALLEQVPWGAERWTVDEVLVRRPVRDRDGELFDETTVAHICRTLFGTGPTWIDDDLEATGAVLSALQARATDDSRVPARSADSREHYTSRTLRTGLAATDRPQHWWFHLSVDVQGTRSPSIDAISSSSGLPITAAAAEDGRWCAVLGWPAVDVVSPELDDGLASALLSSWLRSESEFNDTYASIGGDCVVLRVDCEDAAVRSTCRSISAFFDDETLVIQTVATHAGLHSLHGNRDELVLPFGCSAHLDPIDAAVRFDGPELDELQQIIIGEAVGAPGLIAELALDDDVDSAMWVGLLRDVLGTIRITVRHPGSRIARFLADHYISADVDSDARAALSPLSEAVRAENGLEPTGAFIAANPLGTSVRARVLARRTMAEMTVEEILDALWPGLSAVPQPSDGRSGPNSDSLPLEVRRWLKPVWLTDDVQDARYVDRLALRRKRVNRLGIAPDLSLQERFPLSGAFIRGKNERLVVTLASHRADREDGFPEPATMSSVFPDHHLCLVDTTFANGEGLEFGWFFGSPGDNIARRWSAVVRQLRRKLECTEIVVRGSHRAALPAVLVASYLPGSTAEVDGLEAVAGEADPNAMARLTELVGSDIELTRAFADRLVFVDIVDAAGTMMGSTDNGTLLKVNRQESKESGRP